MLSSYKTMGVAPEALLIRQEVTGFDWDGTGVKRQLPALWLTSIKELFAKGLLPEHERPIPEMDHTPVSTHLGFFKRLSIKYQARRKAIPCAVEISNEAIKKGPVYIISGREASTCFDSATRRQADNSGFAYTDIVLKPSGKKGIDSKIHAIKELHVTEYHEDNRKSAIRIAAALPAVSVNYIDYGAHISKKVLEKLPNLRITPEADWNGKKKRKAEGASETRNSPYREKIAPTIEAITRAVHKELPWLSPTHLNILGAAEVAAGAIVAATRDPFKKDGEKLKTLVSSVLIIKGSLLDAFDGSLARLKASEDPGSVDFKKGGIFDVLSDRFQELVLALSRAVQAAKRKSKIGALAALAAAVTNPWPSITRAFSEMRGKHVPESGKGIVGLIGTRPGKAVLGGIATEFPNPGGLPLQPAIDIAITASSIITAGRRLITALGPGEAVLSNIIRGEARTRLRFLGATGIVAGVGAGLTYLLLKDRINAEPEPKREADFLDAVNDVETYCRINKLDHRMVGGVVTEFIGPQTEFRIDVANKTVTLIKPNRPTLRRKDGSIRDIDLIAFTYNQGKYWEAKRDFGEWSERMKEQGFLAPKISVEAARHPAWPMKRSKLRQFVTAWELWESYEPVLAFGDIRKAIKPGSIEPWILDTGLGVKLTMLHPVAHALCYELRVPSGVKKKDREEIGYADRSVIPLPYSKISLVRAFARQTIEEGKKHRSDYENLFREWREYIDELTQNPDRLTAVKSRLTGLWWDTVGEWFTHHTSGLNDKMTG